MSTQEHVYLFSSLQWFFPVIHERNRQMDVSRLTGREKTISI